MNAVKKYTGTYQGRTKTINFTIEVMNRVVIEATFNVGWMIGKKLEVIKPWLLKNKAKVKELSN